MEDGMLVYESENPDLLHENMGVGQEWGASPTNGEPPTNNLASLSQGKRQRQTSSHVIYLLQFLVHHTCLMD